MGFQSGACMEQAVHTPTRRREELSATPTAAMRGVAAHLAAALRDTLLDAQARTGLQQLCHTAGSWDPVWNRVRREQFRCGRGGQMGR